jgi:hypothetical protein
MRSAKADALPAIAGALLSLVLVIGISAATNTVDINAFTSDFNYYIAMAQYGFAKPGASPFAYRYLTTLIVHGLAGSLGISIGAGFRTVAYAGAFLQLFGVFLFSRWFTRSLQGAYVALLVTAFSLYNVKFLFFDVFRPDHLSYALILLQTYLAFKRKFVPLLVVTLIASQIREFNLLPLVAYLVAFLPQENRSAALWKAGVSIAGILLAVGLPRLLIPVTESYQFVDLSRDGLLRGLIAPLVWSRDVNFLYCIVAYLLPVLMLVRLDDIRAGLRTISREVKTFLLVYVVLVLILSFFGGTDFYRFDTFLFLPQAMILGLLAPRYRLLPLVLMVVAVFVFNRIWLPFPVGEVNGRIFVDMYGGYATRFNIWSVLRILECAGLILVGLLARRLYHPTGVGQSLAVNDFHQ